jgi:hypothetical protein
MDGGGVTEDVRADVVPRRACLPRFEQEAQHPVERQALQRHLRQPAPQVLRQEREEEPEPIAVRLDGRWAQASLKRQLIDEKCVEQGAVEHAFGVEIAEEHT